MERLSISLRLPADLIQMIDAEAEAKRRTRTLILTDVLEQHFIHNNNNNQKPAAKTRKKAQAK